MESVWELSLGQKTFVVSSDPGYVFLVSDFINDDCAIDMGVIAGTEDMSAKSTFPVSGELSSVAANTAQIIQK